MGLSCRKFTIEVRLDAIRRMEAASLAADGMVGVDGVARSRKIQTSTSTAFSNNSPTAFDMKPPSDPKSSMRRQMSKCRQNKRRVVRETVAVFNVLLFRHRFDANWASFQPGTRLRASGETRQRTEMKRNLGYNKFLTRSTSLEVKAQLIRFSSAVCRVVLDATL
jgi:hypothetical protein